MEKGKKKGWREVREEEPSRVASGAQREKKLVQAENKLFATRMSLMPTMASYEYRTSTKT